MKNLAQAPINVQSSKEGHVKNARFIIGFALKAAARLGALFICASATASDLHPIVEVQSGYLFGAASDGKWLEAEESARSVKADTTYQIYSLTAKLGEATGSAPKSVDETLSRHNGGHAVRKTGGRRVCSGRAMECVAAKATHGRYNSASLRRCGPGFIKNEGIEQPKVKIDNILSRRFGRRRRR